jgi:hypothetical protein
VLCHGSVAGPSTPYWVLGLQCRGLSCMAGPLTGVMPAARAWSRQRGWAQHPFLGALSRKRCFWILGAVNHDLPCPGSVYRECVHGWAWVGSWLEMLPWHWSTSDSIGCLRGGIGPPSGSIGPAGWQHWLPKVWHWSTEWQHWLSKVWHWPHRVAVLAV